MALQPYNAPWQTSSIPNYYQTIGSTSIGPITWTSTTSGSFGYVSEQEVKVLEAKLEALTNLVDIMTNRLIEIEQKLEKSKCE